MNNNLLRNGASGIAVRVLALLVVFALFFTADFSAIALDSYFSDKTLAEKTFVLNTDDDVVITLSGLMPVNGRASAVSAEVDGEDVLYAYDISIYYADGSEFEPVEDSPISVSFNCYFYPKSALFLSLLLLF